MFAGDASEDPTASWYDIVLKSEKLRKNKKQPPIEDKKLHVFRRDGNTYHFAKAKTARELFDRMDVDDIAPEKEDPFVMSCIDVRKGGNIHRNLTPQPRRGRVKPKPLMSAPIYREYGGDNADTLQEFSTAAAAGPSSHPHKSTAMTAGFANAKNEEFCDFLCDMAKERGGAKRLKGDELRVNRRAIPNALRLKGRHSASYSMIQEAVQQLEKERVGNMAIRYIEDTGIITKHQTHEKYLNTSLAGIDDDDVDDDDDDD